VLKKIIVVLLLILGIWSIFNRALLRYGWMQAKGQINILLQVKDVHEVLSDPTYPDSLKARIRLVEEIKQFGVDSLGLTPSENYTTYYEQHGKPILWVITASDPYKINPYHWKFPIIGSFPYKGFFDSTRAETERKILADQGFDTDIGEVSGWSTLGYLKDPILSNMLRRKEGSLANLILHELTHGTVFVKNDSKMNENLASFVGDLGAIRFLKQKYGENSDQLKAYDYAKKYNDAYSQHILRGVGKLDSLYNHFESTTPTKIVKDSLKTAMIHKIMSDSDTLLGGSFRPYLASEPLPNNAFFISYQTYRSEQNVFQEEFSTKFGGDFKKYLSYLKQKYHKSFLPFN
jgi:predicted aminopeptidase